MHKFMRTIGFSKYQKRVELEFLLTALAAEAKRSGKVEKNGEDMLWELRAELAEGMGVAMVGELDSDGTFYREYYFPYVKNTGISSQADCSIQRHAEKETYAGLLDEYRVGISLIFYMENSMEYRMRRIKSQSSLAKSVSLTGLSVQGKVLLPIMKTRQQQESLRQASRQRSSLIEAAKNGDEDAIETLTIEDIDAYSMVTRRIENEDIYSIIDTCFMPCGVECDQYSVIGEIVNIETRKNRMTNEEIYNLELECNDMNFHVAINKKDLLGEPALGRRFKGQVWMQGTAEF